MSTTTAAVLRSERVRHGSLPSLRAGLLLVPLVTAGFGALGAASEADTDPLFSAFFGVLFGQVAALAHGTLAMTSDCRGGGLRIAFAAVPERGRWYGAKIAVVGAYACAAGLLAGLASALLGAAVTGDASVGLGSAAGWRATVGCALYLTLVTWCAVGLAALLRSGVAVLGITVPLLLLLPFVIGDSAGGAARFLPDRAGQLALHLHPDGGPLGPWTGLGVLALWAAAALAAGGWRLLRRDA
ncbi:ABC transporter permease [Streptomyces sp. NPDC049954]|uniref:ABC transporter permease n=1 Tax=Streptomyces sp. NPDC049954 TaxID=3155779 RepID=UPI00342F395B